MKALFITEKPSVAREFAAALNINAKNRDGYMEGDKAVITWCVGHLVTMSYPDQYDPALKKWDLETIPFIPDTFKYETIPGVQKQFDIVSSLLNREDIDTIYVCTDSGREGEYIYRLVDQQANVSKDKKKKRVWIDSQTKEEVIRGVKEAKDLSEYDNLAAAAYLRAKEDYLMGINFSRVLTLKYGWTLGNYLNQKRSLVVAVGRVMTCVLGMIVKREREIRTFVPTPFYRILGHFDCQGFEVEAEWKAVKGSKYFESKKLYKDNGFLDKKDAQEFIKYLEDGSNNETIVVSSSKRQEKKNPPLLYNLAELQNECSKRFKLSPDETLKVIQDLYEKKLVTYPRTDARVLSSAVAKEIYKNIGGLNNYTPLSGFANEIMQDKKYQGIIKSKYVDDKKITDHYAIIPTGQAVGSLSRISEMGQKVYDVIVRRFLSIFMPPAVYLKIKLETQTKGEAFFANFKMLKDPGYLKVTGMGGQKKEAQLTEEQIHAISSLKKGMSLPVKDYTIKDGTTSAPKRYNSGSLILAMENAGQLIEDEDLREQIKGSGIGTSATRAEIVKKLVSNKYIALNKKTQIVTPTLTGEMIVNVVSASIGSLLNPTLTASWEKGLTYVAEGSVTEEEYMQKLDKFVTQKTNIVKQNNFQYQLRQSFDQIAPYYQKKK
ncbi:DNA topoisomerase [Anaerostipes hadrus]|uniref:DNA topoisomerase n=1 Tax=Anaerostipes hadrus TaxID=649756 RepID=UPI0002A2D140|nr:DNA topoisomerase [Anaerostipes hadrus]EKY23690.1 DNA topoisomerase [Anaerostipes hadrus ATCC 29173 = JCM 17467]BEG59717.1 DNA topoisomerase 3 [Anaerostipes hadrus ATCC 29173 = JCM 17467]